MRHDFFSRLTRDGRPYLVCSLCGATYAADTPLDTVNESVCKGRPHVMSEYPPDWTQAQLDNGSRLIDAWRKEGGEF